MFAEINVSDGSRVNSYWLNQQITTCYYLGQIACLTLTVARLHPLFKRALPSDKRREQPETPVTLESSLKRTSISVRQPASLVLANMFGPFYPPSSSLLSRHCHGRLDASCLTGTFQETAECYAGTKSLEECFTSSKPSNEEGRIGVERYAPTSTKQIFTTTSITKTRTDDNGEPEGTIHSHEADRPYASWATRIQLDTSNPCDVIRAQLFSELLNRKIRSKGI
ncbi:uncharacterized protein LOC110827997 [Zootermopsis nevadensis]|uniref:uncharacterized protein LOC110827997 n=1 Tax=Zootermopsis nevadensis TaxID=136037 RepID=UPI000B8E5D27|nr:uncharacterized protein LOC110827997 [Zootermopsis nevadensis]